MIEVKYNENGQADGPASSPVKIPKNIRQIGEIHSHKKIYVEDYVITYLRQVARREDGIPQAAVLLGTTGIADGVHYTFASGAAETDKIEIDHDGIQFTDEAWTDLYAKIKEYFDDLEIVGWILIVPGLAMAINADIVKAHMKNFPGEDKVFMMMEPEEKEESFYVFENGELLRQKGYYIYFEKNASMQEYMIARNENVSIEVKEKSEDKAAVNFRRIVQDREEDKHQKKMMAFMYTASSFLVMIVLVIGITMVNNYDKMRDMEESLQAISRSVTGDDDENARASDNSSIPVEDVPAAVEPVEGDKDDEEDDEKQEETKDEKVNADDVRDVPETYTVMKGDTLAEICMKVYGDKSMVKKVCERNNIEDGDKIMTGQILILP